MKWINKPDPPTPKLGGKRIIRRFLFVPTRLENETRWLEFAYIQQYAFPRMDVLVSFVDWEDYRFIDKKPALS